MSDERDALEARLVADEWLEVPDAAVVLGVDKATLYRWLRDGVRVGGRRFTVGYREMLGGGRTCNPADVRTLLEESRREYRADA